MQTAMSRMVSKYWKPLTAARMLITSFYLDGYGQITPKPIASRVLPGRETLHTGCCKPTAHRVSYALARAAAAMIAAKSSATKHAPPTKAPSTSGQAISSAAFLGFTLPPYWITIDSAVARS